MKIQKAKAETPTFRSARITEQCRSTTPGLWVVYEFF